MPVSPPQHLRETDMFHGTTSLLPLREKIYLPDKMQEDEPLDSPYNKHLATVEVQEVKIDLEDLQKPFVSRFVGNPRTHQVREALLPPFLMAGELPLPHEECLLSHRLAYPFCIQTGETQNFPSFPGSGAVNSFRYADETLAEMMEGAGWAFPSPSYGATPHVLVHNQGYEILLHQHFPSGSNWNEIMKFCLSPSFNFHAALDTYSIPYPEPQDEACFVPKQRYWNKLRDYEFRLHFYSKLEYSEVEAKQLAIQKQLKAAKTAEELDGIYRGLSSRNVKRKRRLAAVQGEAHRRLQRHT